MIGNSKWKKIKSWNVGTPDGDVETYSLYEEESSGALRIQNDFGNVTIDMERMSGHEFIKKAYKEIDDIISPGSCSDDDWLDDLSYDSNNDCDYTD